MSELHVEYRPDDLDDVIGQDATVKALKKKFKDKTIPHAILFTGGSGCGKTTLARIIGAEVGCSGPGLMEIDAATNTGIDAWREIASQLQYTNIGKSPNKFVIIDECHQLSKSSWNSLLKIIEEPPAHVYFVLCTTELSKVPKTIRTRCQEYALKDVRVDDLRDLLDDVADAEEMDLPKGAVELIARQSDGSPRRALTYLAQANGCTTKDEVADILKTPLDDKEVIEFVKMITGRKPKWKDAQAFLKEAKQLNPESVRITIVNYCNACILNSNSEGDAMRFLAVMEEFADPIYEATGVAELTLATANVIFD